MAKTLTQPLPPGTPIGILGSGQLGRMAALAAHRLGYPCHIYGPESEAPANQVTTRHSVAPYDDLAALAAFAEAVGVVTFEFESVPAESTAFLAERVPVHPRPEVLAVCRNRLREKSLCRDLGIATAPFAAVRSEAGLNEALAAIGRPAVLKTTELGYDGKGQVLIEEAGDPGVGDPGAAWRAIMAHNPNPEAILEGFVAFEREISVIVARGLDGAMALYDPVENIHKDHILDRTIAPAPIAADLGLAAQRIARDLAEGLDLVGLLAVEMFVTPDGGLLVNELAPRPHNSGHWTQDACVTDQFELFIRAVAGLPLGSTARHSDAVMQNLLGDDIEAWHEILNEPGAKLHLYGKASARPGRKMGHVNRLTRKS